jgi:hypothetical protein
MKTQNVKTQNIRKMAASMFVRLYEKLRVLYRTVDNRLLFHYGWRLLLKLAGSLTLRFPPPWSDTVHLTVHEKHSDSFTFTLQSILM